MVRVIYEQQLFLYYIATSVTDINPMYLLYCYYYLRLI
jgi:hypothetical protein